MLIQYALAQSPGVTVAASFVETFNEVILFPLITLLIAVALLTFVYGGFEFITNANNSSGRETGRKHMLFGIIGMLVMLSALAILSLAANTFGLGDRLDCVNNPAGPGCAEEFRLPTGPNDSYLPPANDSYAPPLIGNDSSGPR